MKAKKTAQAPKLTSEQIASIQNQAYEIAEIIVSANYFVVDVAMEEEFGRWHLRIFLDHPNAGIRVTLDDCRDISEALSPMIEDGIEELKDFPYNLEVSSPGLFRKLDKPREFRFYQGRRIELKPKGQTPIIAYLEGYDVNTAELLYRLDANEDSEVHRMVWDPKAVELSLAPDLTQPVEVLTVPRTIRRED